MIRKSKLYTASVMGTTELLNLKDTFLDIEEKYWLPENNVPKISCSQQKNYIRDPIRCRMTTLTPEEKVRQHLIRHMLDDLSYPGQLFAIEKSLGSLNVTNTALPRNLSKKRIDCLVFSSEKSYLTPLLLVECKSKTLNRKALLQIIGYNRFINAPAITLCNEHEQLTGIWNESKQHFTFRKGLPSFIALLKLKDFYAKHG